MVRPKTRSTLGLKCCVPRCVSVSHLPNTGWTLRQALLLGLVCVRRECGMERWTEARPWASGCRELSEGEAEWRPGGPARVRPAMSPATWSSPALACRSGSRVCVLDRPWVRTYRRDTPSFGLSESSGPLGVSLRSASSGRSREVIWGQDRSEMSGCGPRDMALAQACRVTAGLSGLTVRRSGLDGGGMGSVRLVGTSRCRDWSDWRTAGTLQSRVSCGRAARKGSRGRGLWSGHGEGHAWQGQGPGGRTVGKPQGPLMLLLHSQGSRWHEARQHGPPYPDRQRGGAEPGEGSRADPHQ